ILLTLYGFIRAEEGPKSFWWLAGSVVGCVLGVTAKETVFVAPLLVLLYDRTFVSGGFIAAARQRMIYYCCLLISWPALGWLLLREGWTRGEAAGFGLGVSPWQYALTQFHAITLYLKLCVWPHPLVADYGTELIGHTLDVWPEMLLIGVLAGGTIWATVRRFTTGFLGGAFLLLLAPSSSVVPLITQTIAEHRMYLPSAVLLTGVVMGVYACVGRRSVAVAGAVAATFALITFFRNLDYSDELR